MTPHELNLNPCVNGQHASSFKELTRVFTCPFQPGSELSTHFGWRDAWINRTASGRLRRKSIETNVLTSSDGMWVALCPRHSDETSCRGEAVAPQFFPR